MIFTKAMHLTSKSLSLFPTDTNMFRAETKAILRRSCSRGFRFAAVTTEEGTIYQLADSGCWFKASRKDQETRK